MVAETGDAGIARAYHLYMAVGVVHWYHAHG